MTEPERSLEQLEQYRSTWDRAADRLRLGHIVAGILATICPVLAAAQRDQPWSIWVTVLGSACAALLSLVDLRGLANRTRRAWRILTKALLVYRADPTAEAYRRLVADYYYADCMIGDVTPDQDAAARIKAP